MNNCFVKYFIYPYLKMVTGATITVVFIVPLLLFVLVGCTKANIDRTTYSKRLNCKKYDAPAGVLYKCNIGNGDICYIWSGGYAGGLSCKKI